MPTTWMGFSSCSITEWIIVFCYYFFASRYPCVLVQFVIVVVVDRLCRSLLLSVYFIFFILFLFSLFCVWAPVVSLVQWENYTLRSTKSLIFFASTQIMTLKQIAKWFFRSFVQCFYSTLSLLWATRIAFMVKCVQQWNRFNVDE